MLLKSIDILGFKSFADKTRLEFSEGITALLGPNGCGKSNVVDAVKWVLGEQSAKMLRADRMGDVIFNGTENRKALNVAEVTLLLSNEQEELPLDMPEISVKRRLFRFGESEYFINNHPVRLREIKELFFDTGVGKSAYSIMEQGRIDQILSNKPEERRLVFEEAAGITRFQVRSAEAERKLERTRENIRQVEGILGEVKRSYDTLKRQAVRTEEYRTLKELTFEAELDIQLLRLRGLFEQRDSSGEKLQEQIVSRDTLRKEIESIKTEMEQGIDKVNTMETRLVDYQKELYRVDLEKHNIESQMRMLQEQRVDLERKISSEEDRERTVRNKMERTRTALQDRKLELEKISGLLEDVRQNIEGFERDIAQFEIRIDENDKGVRRFGVEVLDLERKIETLRAELRTITDDIVTQLDHQLKDLGYSAQDRRRSEKVILSVLKTLKIQLSSRSKLFEDYERVGTLSSTETVQILFSVRDFLDKILSKVDELDFSFDEYKKSTPVFLEDFLAPKGIITQKREIDRLISEALEIITQKRAQAEELREENRALGVKIVEYRKTLEDLRVNRARMNTRCNGLEDEIKRVNLEIAEQEIQLKENIEEIRSSKQRLENLISRISGCVSEKQRLEQKDQILRKELAALEKKIARKNGTLQTQEERLKRRSTKLEGLQASVEKLQLSQVEVNTEIRDVYRNFQEIHSRDLGEYESRLFELEGSIPESQKRLQELKESIKQLGQVNLMAPEEFSGVDERYQFLSGQLSDLQQALNDLKKVTEEIRTESAELFIETFGSIRKNFHLMFRRLFGGGRAEIRLLSPENVLESGIDILAQPPGKKMESIALLSGGERSLTAMALMFAMYMVRPSPFCILDEIDAALDEQNVIRFAQLLAEFASNSQFIVVTHNKKTITCANALLGVTMEESGVSKIVSLKLENKVEEKTSA